MAFNGANPISSEKADRLVQRVASPNTRESIGGAAMSSLWL